MNDHPILLFDGVCNLCSGFVQFMIERDPAGKYRFASLQSDSGKALLQQYHLPIEEMSTVVLIEDSRAYTHSDVALRVAPQLKGFWGWVRIGYLLPKSLRDRIYNWVAANRYRWFGKKEACWIPTPDLKARFLED